MTIDVDETVKAIATRKALVFTAETGPSKVKATLTPVGTERKAILPNDVPGVFMSNEALRDVAKDLRRQAQLLIDVADGIDELVGTEDPIFEGVGDGRKRTDIETRLEGSDPEPLGGYVTGQPQGQPVNPVVETFKAQFAAQTAAAQAATFKQPEVDLVAEAHRIFDVVDASSGSPAPGWVCPEHGDANIADLKSGKGRKYRACGICKQFEK